MPTEAILLFGAGGHAKVVLDTLLLNGAVRADVDVTDDSAALHGADFLGAPVRAPGECGGRRFHVAIGVARAREAVQARLLAQGRQAINVIHPRASLSPLAALGQGVFMAAQAVVAPAARLGDAVIVNHGAIVDHDCVVGGFTHIAPHATLGGNVTIGRRVLIGAGATILPGVQVGDDCVIGAGAVVTASVAAGGTWVGVPAKPLRRETK
jgi:sugar O-acyltransferase (sialic acid O-acetyltransferase NeuD family)